MQFSGSCALVRHGETCYRITGIGATRTVVWRDNGVWEKLLEILIDKPDDEWLMIDASIARFILMPVAQEAAIKK